MDDEPIVLTQTAQGMRLETIWGLIARQIHRQKTLLKFTLVGLLGYLLYTVALFLTYDVSLPFMPDKHTKVDFGLFTHSDLRLLIGTIIAAQVSITGGFFPRDLWVFSDWQVVRKPGWVRFVQYQAKSLVSTLGILTIVVNLLSGSGSMPHYVSTPIGVAIGFVWNWLWESGFIWRASRT